MTQAMSLAYTSNDPMVSLNRYIADADAFPQLSADEERVLVDRFYNQGDLAAAQSLVLSHLRYVVYLAKSYQGYGLALGDLVQEGTVGLMKAVKRFQPDHGVRLVTYAAVWIKSEIQEFILRNWRVVRMATTKAQRTLFFNLRRHKQHTGWLTAQERTQIANDLAVSEADVSQMESRLYGQDVPFEPIEPASDESDYRAELQLAGPSALEPLRALEGTTTADKQRLYQAIIALDDRSKTIIEARWLVEESDKRTLKQLSQELGVSLERVRQLEQRALAQLGDLLQA